MRKSIRLLPPCAHCERLDWSERFLIGARISRHHEPVRLKLTDDLLLLRNDLLQNVTDGENTE